MATPICVFHNTLKNKVEMASSALGVPASIPATALLALSAGCIGRARHIQIAQGWQEHANLFLVITGRSGAGKTPCINAIFKPLYDVEEEYINQMPIAEGSEADCEPPLTQHVVEDFTVQAIAKVLSRNPRGLILLHDEIASFLGRTAGSHAARSDMRKFLIAGANSNRWSISRVAKGRSRIIPAATLSLLGGIQPNLLAQVFTMDDVHSGLLPRFLFTFVEPEPPSLTPDQGFVAGAELEHLVDALLGMGLGERKKSQGISLSPEARVLFFEWRNRNRQTAYESENPELFEPLEAKLASQAARLCLNLHCMDAVMDCRSELDPVTPETMNRAITLADWFRTQSYIVLESVTGGEDTGDGIILKGIADLFIQSGEGPHPTSLIAEYVNRSVPEKRKLSPRSVGRGCGRLGFERRHTASVNSWIITAERLRQLIGYVPEPPHTTT